MIYDQLRSHPNSLSCSHACSSLWAIPPWECSNPYPSGQQLATYVCILSLLSFPALAIPFVSLFCKLPMVSSSTAFRETIAFHPVDTRFHHDCPRGIYIVWILAIPLIFTLVVKRHDIGIGIPLQLGRTVWEHFIIVNMKYCCCVSHIIY